MIAHIDQHFNPSGAVDSLGYIFDLIDIKQLDQESVITLKACFLMVFSNLKMGVFGLTLRSKLVLCFAHCFTSTKPWFRSFGWVAIPSLRPPSKQLWNSAQIMTRTHGRARLGKTASPSPAAHPLRMPPVLTAKALTGLSPPSPSITISAAGIRLSKSRRASA